MDGTLRVPSTRYGCENSKRKRGRYRHCPYTRSRSNNMDRAEGLCSSCIRNRHVRERLHHETATGTCLSCGTENVALLPAASIVDMLLAAFDKHLQRGDFESYGDDEIAHEQGEPAEQVIEYELGVPYECAVELLERMNEKVAALGDADEAVRSYSRVVDKRPPSRYWLARWNRFERRLQHEARFFDPEAAAFLADAFGAPDLAQIAIPEMSSGAVRVLSPHEDQTLLFRARSATSASHARKLLKAPETELGPPRGEIASAGRMNPAGVAVFYGAFSLDVALAEIRPPVGGLVVVGEFVPTRNLRLLDLNKITSTVCAPSIFSDAYDQECDMVSFLRELERRASEPLQPQDTALGYLATQAVAEYLSSCYKLDGMIYSSSQVGVWKLPQRRARDSNPHARCNVVLFRSASGVQPNEPDGSIRLKRASVRRITHIEIASDPVHVDVEGSGEEVTTDWEALLANDSTEF
jgi:hypothetical protein